jgi:hypothetical protein
MSNEVKYAYANAVTLESSGASGSSVAFIAATTGSLSSTNHSDYPDADFCLTVVSFGALVGAGMFINLYRQDMDIDGTLDSPAPSTTYKNCLVGTFLLPCGGSGSGSYPCPNIPLSKICQFYIENQSGTSLTAGWSLKATPKSFVPGA